MQQITILGATGSIGQSTLEVLRLHRDKYQVFALSSNNNKQLLLQQCVEFKPRYAWINNRQLAYELTNELIAANLTTKVLTNATDLNYLASHEMVDIVVSAIVGSAGLSPTYASAISGKRILLANKESLVAAGELITQAAIKNKALIIPVDSEHNAIFQALPFAYESLSTCGVHKLILTASGGPFLNKTKQQLQRVSAKEALCHPNWSMGQKISIDSASLMNKGLEVIEAHWLFNANLTQIEVIVHPQSIIHSMVEYLDGSILAQLGVPDMKTPISYALSAPQRISSGSKYLDFTTLSQLSFQAPDLERFPCLKLAQEGLAAGGNACTIINASNEVAVAKFLTGEHSFYAIPQMIERALNKFNKSNAKTLEEIISLDQQVKEYCTK